MALARYQSTAVDDAGNVLPLADITVTDEATSALAVLYSDRDGLVADVGNPFTAEADGSFGFHVAGGAYRIDLVLGGSSRTLRYVAIGTGGEIDVYDTGGFNAKAFGAKGDGTTDDLTALQAAADAAYAAGGGIIELPIGTFIVSDTLEVPTSVSFNGGLGWGSIIKASSGFPSSTPVVQIGYTGSGIQAHNSRIQNLIIDCSGKTGSIGVYSAQVANGSGIFNCAIIDALQHYIKIDNADSLYPTNWEINNLHAYNNSGVNVAGTFVGVLISGNIGPWMISNAVCNVSASTTAGAAAYRIQGDGDGNGCWNGDFHNVWGEKFAKVLDILSGRNISATTVASNYATGTTIAFDSNSYDLSFLNVSCSWDTGICITDGVNGESVAGDATGSAYNSVAFYTIGFGGTRLTSDPRCNYNKGEVPVTITGNYTVPATTTTIINNKAGSSCVLTLPAAATYKGRRLRVKTIQAQTVTSVASDVVPRAGGSAGTAILSGTAGQWAELISDGTNWIIMAGS